MKRSNNISPLLKPNTIALTDQKRSVVAFHAFPRGSDVLGAFKSLSIDIATAIAAITTAPTASTVAAVPVATKAATPTNAEAVYHVRQPHSCYTRSMTITQRGYTPSHSGVAP